MKTSEQEGFEPSVRLPAHLISSQARSATPASLPGVSIMQISTLCVNSSLICYTES